MSAPVEPPVVTLPAPVDRTLRLGPFPDARAALRFVLYVAAGAFVAVALGPVAWLPFLGGGFALTVLRPQGRALDEQLGAFVRWRLGPRRSGSRGPWRPIAPSARAARLRSGRWVAGVAAGGVPVAFLPPADARDLFDAYRRFLRANEDGLVLSVGAEPLSGRTVRLADPPATDGADGAARSGYDEMVRLLCRRRRRRRVDVLLSVPADGPGAVERLTIRVGAIERELAGLGIPSVPLRGRFLANALAHLGADVLEVG